MPKFGLIILCLALVALWGFVNSCTKKSTDPEPTRPEAPTNLVGTAIDTVSISLSWQDNSNNEEGFQVYSWDGVQWGSIGTKVANTTHDTVAGLWPGTEYSFRVKAFNSMGESDFSNSAVVTTKQILIPSAPENLALQTLDYNRILISWTDNSNDETGFAVQRRLQTASFVTITVTASNDTSYSDNSLDAQTLYYYRVGAVGQDGTGWSEDDTASTWPYAVPEAPSNLQADVVMGVGVSLAWQDNSLYEHHFIIWRSDDGGDYRWIDSVDANVRVYLDPFVLEAHRYVYYVVASNTVGVSESSNDVNVYYGYYSKGAIPLARENYWIYDVSDSGGDYTYREHVSRVDLFDSAPWFLMYKEHSDTGDIDTSTYLRNEDSDENRGVLFREQGFIEGELLWKYPASEDDFFFVEGDCVLVVGTEEDVEVPMGYFEECYIYTRFSDGGTTIETAIKPQVGILRVRVYDGLELLSEQELIEYRLYGPL